MQVSISQRVEISRDSDYLVSFFNIIESYRMIWTDALEEIKIDSSRKYKEIPDWLYELHSEAVYNMRGEEPAKIGRYEYSFGAPILWAYLYDDDNYSDSHCLVLALGDSEPSYWLLSDREHADDICRAATTFFIAKCVNENYMKPAKK